jgi:hypothetical protein
MTDEEISEFYKKQILSSPTKKTSPKTLSKKKSIEWKFIPKPSPSRLTIAPEGGKKYLVSDRTIEKIVFGDYFMIQYLIKNTKNACFLYPDLILSAEAIKFIYDLKDLGIPFPNDWKDLKTELTQNHPNLLKEYEKTRFVIEDNFNEIRSALKPNVNGPRLERSEPHYHRLIYRLIERMMNKQRIEFDTSGKDAFEIPYFDRFEKCIQGKNRYIVFFLRLKTSDGYHANMILVDKKDKTVERFEPQGSEHGFYDNQVVDDQLKSYFQKMGYTYIDPTSMMCPYGVQDIIETYDVTDKYKISGFCKMWSFLYALFRLSFNKVDQNTLVNHMEELVKKTAKTYLKQRFQKKISAEEYEDYDFVIEFLYDYIPSILEEGKNDLNKVNQMLGTNIILEGRMLYSD